jgi:hypothetical protein
MSHILGKKMINFADVEDFIKDSPYIKFPGEWRIKFVPPYKGATFRFYVELPSGSVKSVYFDKDGNLGADTNYWEVYQIHPNHYNLQTKRCDKKDIKKLLEIIGYEEELNKILEQHNLWLETNGNEGARANFYKADLEYVNLNGANLEKANFEGANLNGANLSGANLQLADLSEASLFEASLFKADLRGSNFEKANLVTANLSGADFFEATLSGANLSGANLHRANLEEANLLGADLSGADLSRANLEGANLCKTILENANFEGANLEGAVGLPRGLNT